MTERFPAVGDAPWELRFTRRALADLGADRARDTPGDVAAVRRAATWHDPDIAVVWFLGFTPEHDYTLFEGRAAAGALLPDENDEVLLELEREQLGFRTRIRSGLDELVQHAANTPGAPQRGTVGGILRLELSATVIRSGNDALCDVWILVHLPLEPDASHVPGWPGKDLLITLADMLGASDLDYPTEVPTGRGSRPVDPRSELAILARNILLDP